MNKIIGFAVVLAALSALPSVASAQLQPPPPMGAPQQNPPGYPGSAPTSGTVAQLNNAESEDSGRRLELVYARADVGGGYLSGAGAGGFFGFGGAVGVRLVSFTLGARVRDYLAGNNTLFLNGEAAYHLVLGAGDLVLGGHGGFITNTSGAGSGGNVGLDVGYDHYLTSLFSVGVHASPDLLFTGGDPLVAIFGGARLGLHFGL